MHGGNLDLGRLLGVVPDVAVLAGLAALIASCSGIGANAPSATQSPTTTTTITTQSPTLSAPTLPAPTEKNVNPVCGKLFTPTVLAPAEPTAIPENRESSG
jgi:hypothetical protein